MKVIILITVSPILNVWLNYVVGKKKKVKEKICQYKILKKLILSINSIFC